MPVVRMTSAIPAVPSTPPRLSDSDATLAAVRSDSTGCASETRRSMRAPCATAFSTSKTGIMASSTARRFGVTRPVRSHRSRSASTASMNGDLLVDQSVLATPCRRRIVAAATAERPRPARSASQWACSSNSGITTNRTALRMPARWKGSGT